MIPNDPVVRSAVEADADGIYDLLVLMHKEVGNFTLSETKVRGLIDRCVRCDRAIAGVVHVDGKVVGAVGMVVEPQWWTDDLSLIEQFNFVHPEQRRAHNATKLINFAKSCSDRLIDDYGIPLLIGVFDTSPRRTATFERAGRGKAYSRNKRMEAKLRFYENMLQPAGAFFTHNMDRVNVR